MDQTYRENLLTTFRAQIPEILRKDTEAAVIEKGLNTLVDALLNLTANVAARPIEEEFLRVVQRLNHIGYGRMIQIIYGEWEQVMPGVSRRDR